MPQANNERLDSWKAIADFLKVDIRTARRWESERGLPVYRVPGGGRRAVYADASEIETWLRSGRPPIVEHSGESDDPNIETDPPLHREPMSAESGPSNDPVTGGNGIFRERKFKTRFAVIAAIGMCLLAGLFVQLGRSRSASNPETRIESVSPIYDKVTQTVVIRGRGFGPRPQIIQMDPLGGVDTVGDSNHTSLVILNQGRGKHDWIAGRASAVNHCDISVRLEEWSDSEIVISGFSGPLGSGCGEDYQISAGDQLEIQVFGPGNQCGPGGIPNCPDEVGKHHIGVFPVRVLPAPNGQTPCRK